MPKPIVIHVEGNNYGDSTTSRDALSCFIKLHTDCDTLTFDQQNDLDDNKLNVAKLLNNGMILLLMVMQDRYDNKEHVELIEYVRDELSATIPIVVVKNFLAKEKLDTTTTHAHVSFVKSDDDAIKLIEELRLTWKAPNKSNDAFDVRSTEEVALLSGRLEAIHRSEEDQEDVIELGAVDRNHRIVSQAMRTRIAPALNLQIAFESLVRKIESDRTSLPIVEPSTYYSDLEKVRSLNDEDRENFYHELLYATGHVPYESGGVLKHETGNENNFGYAIDVVTFEVCMTCGFGNHSLAKYELTQRLEHLLMLRRERGLIPKEVKSKNRYSHMEVICGTLMPNIEGYSVPILVIYDDSEDPESVSKIASYIRNQKQFIPVRGKGELLGD